MKFRRLIALLLAAILLLFSACSNESTVELSTTKAITTIADTTIKEATALTKPTAEKSTTTTTTTTNASTTKKHTDITQQATTQKESKPNKVITTTTTKSSSKPTTPPTTKQTTTKKETTVKAVPSCVLIINCSTILSNMSDLKAGHESYVPSSGYILKGYRVEYSSGDTAYDILKKGCEANSIKLTAKQSVYGVYVAGIGNLDEKDCGKYSGWLYSVNGTQPNVACSKYIVNENDTIEFHYTCNY